MNYPTFFIKIKIIFSLLVVISIAIPSILLLLIVSILFRGLQPFQSKAFHETLKRFKHLFILLFYSIKIIFTDNCKDYRMVRCLLYKIKLFNR